MKRLHVHVAVADLQQSVRFYATLFAAEPTVLKDDYAKWMLEDPRVNFAISARGAAAGIEHLGIQVEDEAELADVHARLRRAEGPVLDEGATTCCYATSTKAWIADPTGIAWETFLTTGEHTTYGDSALIQRSGAGVVTACCGPKPDFAAMAAASGGPKPDAAPETAPSCCG
ncbi:catechol 2,3-dioxygenase-like lactoylglutathione lyase family enzyme [Azospirillum brasilense]|uniref:Catechol 2,3-dioxygenase-like lactoylglutathione lyase family enzyme n=1 Tax=Azospirillum brasilense TaxID=192 RepID=A0A560CSR7_AZOBR|nr:ArsI/CadI family heavy metal resistance metalloenzyme [Azospirillum brasilense]TWA87903.1 catechol 2,3-dioxygenase-like lactoylglutathione lyase family enzyme [Azospirillum brasilense]